MTRLTTCWWCGERVFFYRDENGGRALFNKLGTPWPIHKCWLAHMQEKKLALAHVTRDLLLAGYDGRFYKPTGKKRHHQKNGEHMISVRGYVADNHVWYTDFKPTHIHAATGVATSSLVEIEVADFEDRIFTFLIPESVAHRINDYDPIRVKGFWIKRRNRWLLFASSIARYAGKDRNHTRLKAVPTPKSRECNLCRKTIEESGLWGLDSSYRLECSRCGTSRRRISPKDFIALCLSVAKANAK